MIVYSGILTLVLKEDSYNGQTHQKSFQTGSKRQPVIRLLKARVKKRALCLTFVQGCGYGPVNERSFVTNKNRVSTCRLTHPIAYKSEGDQGK